MWSREPFKLYFFHVDNQFSLWNLLCSLVLPLIYNSTSFIHLIFIRVQVNFSALYSVPLVIGQLRLYSSILITTNLVPNESSPLILFQRCLDYSQLSVHSYKFQNPLIDFHKNPLFSFILYSHHIIYIWLIFHQCKPPFLICHFVIPPQITVFF